MVPSVHEKSMKWIPTISGVLFLVLAVSSTLAMTDAEFKAYVEQIN